MADKNQPNLAVDPNNSSPSKPKNKNKNKAPAKPAQSDQLQDEHLAKLLEQKFKELGMTNEDEKELKKIRKKYRNISKVTLDTGFPGLDDAAKLNKLVEIVNKLNDMNTFFEENAYILEKNQSQLKIERDIYQNELTKISGIKSNLENFAREVQKNNAQIKDINKKFVEEETNRREEIIKNFETTLAEITTKLEEQRVSTQETTVENEKLKEEFKVKLDEYEKREKEFFDQIKELDTKNDDRTKGVLGDLKSIEERAKKSFEIKDEIQAVKKQETEDKMKIAIYSQRFGDLENTFNTTSEVLQKFKAELVRSGSRMKSLHQENKELKQKCEKLENLTLDIMDAKDQIKKRLEVSKKEKDVLRDKCNALQTELQAKTKVLQELEQKKNAV